MLTDNGKSNANKVLAPLAPVHARHTRPAPAIKSEDGPESQTMMEGNGQRPLTL
jgi:hypothetical protein